MLLESSLVKKHFFPILLPYLTRLSRRYNVCTRIFEINANDVVLVSELMANISHKTYRIGLDKTVLN